MWHLCHQVPPSTPKSQRATIKAIKTIEKPMWLVSATSGNTAHKAFSKIKTLIFVLPLTGYIWFGGLVGRS